MISHLCPRRRLALVNTPKGALAQLGSNNELTHAQATFAVSKAGPGPNDAGDEQEGHAAEES